MTFLYMRFDPQAGAGYVRLAKEVSTGPRKTHPA